MIEITKAVTVRIVLLLFLASTARGAVTLSVSPSTVSNNYSGNITLTISGLTNGETVTLEKFLDLNTNNTVDPGEPLVQRVSLTDGYTNAIAGVRNVNVPGDDDGLNNKKIVSRLQFLAASKANQAVGKFRYRVSSPTSHFAAIEQPFTVTPTTYSQSITGRVFVGTSPLTNALVALADPVFDNELVAMTVAGSSGQFTLPAPAGVYRVVACKVGDASVGSLGTAPLITLGTGQTNSIFITNTATSRTITGSLQEQSASTALPGVELFLSSTNGQATLAFTDAAGNFSVPVTPSGAWTLSASSASLGELGCVNLQSPPVVDTSVSDASTGILAPLATGLIYGTLTDETAAPIRGARIEAIDNDGFVYAAGGCTASNGSYCIGLVAGNNWYVQPGAGSLARLGYLGQAAVIGLADGDALPVDLQAHRINAHLQGRIVRDDGSPLSWFALAAYSFDGFNARTLTDANGIFDLGVFGGDWNLNLDEAQLSGLALVQPLLPPWSLSDGATITTVTSVVRRVTGRIVGMVVGTNQVGLAGAVATADTSAGGFDYNLNGSSDDQGHYEIPVFNGTWQVSLGDVSFLGYLTPAPQTTVVLDATNVVNFLLQPLGPLGIMTATLPNAQVAMPYSARLDASGGASPYLWTLASGSVPGLSLAMDGMITGIPNQTGTYMFTVRVTDNLGNSSTHNLPLVVFMPASLMSMNRVSGQEMHLQLSGQSNQSYVLEATTDLGNPVWVPVATNSADSGVITLIDSTATNSQRFYRARQL